MLEEITARLTGSKTINMSELLGDVKNVEINQIKATTKWANVHRNVLGCII